MNCSETGPTNSLILGITDAKGLTDCVSAKSQIEVRDLYRQLFLCQQTVLDKFNGCAWEIVKTTGDGLMFFSKTNPSEDHLRTLTELQKAVADESCCLADIKIRAIACSLNQDKVVNASDIIGSFKLSNWLDGDMFGHELNKAFRLLSTIRSDAIVVDEALMQIVYPNETNDKKSFNKNDLKFSSPVPITALKGIESVGFSNSKNVTIKPHWLWEMI